MAAPNFSFTHPQLGKVTGTDGEVVCFRGIPYATIKNRLAEPQLMNQYSDSVIATSNGPTSLLPPGAFQLEMLLMQQSQSDPQRPVSDLNALHLNIYVPKINGQLPVPGSLPIFAWIHGGGFVSGANSWPHYDMQNLIQLSASQGLPVIGVGINFRLGMSGFLTSSELRTAGYKPNNQLRDQRVAFDWIRKYIGGFGGDSNRLTVAGESTGAVDVGLHLQSEQPLFDRAIMMGGSSLLMPPATAEYQEWIYSRVLELLGIKEATPSERIRALVEAPVEQLISKLSPPLPYRPMIDHDLIKFPVTYDMVSQQRSNATVPGHTWLKGLMVGDCQFDASSMAFFMDHKKPGIAQSFPTHLRGAFPDNPDDIGKLLEIFGFTSEPLDDDMAFKNFLYFVNDLCYFGATATFAEGWSNNCYTFFMNERNPWDGRFKGEATHVIDVSLLFQNFNDQLPTAMQASAKAFATDLFTFMAGRAPWPACTEKAQTARVYGPSSWETEVQNSTLHVVHSLVAPETGRRGAILDIGRRLGLDNLAAAFGSFAAS
ncbi:hypothetical protein JX265_001062 [Neoarthrinium moseri]|uniref:Carboxylic ester hydrolase n=1 Tax=Neoarthrinium moseri TaxID=1658444 RepID=A0A9Q0ARJ8_9PEZI|nr:hypothetical protein JX266_010027 [Neoarthrinium moseri]KAI1880822.1 hypothetical protein JX265_001062 [Neoarthrinium moseri]